MIVENKKESLILRYGFIPLFLLLTAAAITMSDKIYGYALKGLDMALRLIIPSTFFFIIASELLMSIGAEKATPKRVFALGLVCGFPTGALMAKRLNENGIISKAQMCALGAFSNNASPAYVISAVGIGIFGNKNLGILMLFANLISALTTALIFSNKEDIKTENGYILRQSVYFTEVVKRASIGMIYSASYVTLFSVICGLLTEIPFLKSASLFIIPFIEVGAASAIISESCILPIALKFGLTAFSLSFSGISIILQTASYLNENKRFMLRFSFIKLLQGCFSFVISILLYMLFFSYSQG